MKVVMVYIDPQTSLFLYGVNGDEVIFRSSRNPHLQTEKMTIKDGMCYTNLYYFSADYLKKLDPILPPESQG